MNTIGSVLKSKNWMRSVNVTEPARVLCSPDCPVCGGIGYVREDLPVGHPNFGRAIPCPKLPANSSIWDGHGLKASQIASLSFVESIRERENVMDAVRALQAALERGHGMGYLYGGAGLAKSRLLQIACAEWARSGRGLFHLTTQKEIIDDMRAAFDDDEPHRAIRDKQFKYERIPLLAIDEVTVERSTDFKVEQFFHLVNKRHEYGTELQMPILTVMAGNVSPRDLDFRIMDRLSDGRNFVVRLTGDSYRPAMEWEQP